jgi:hypothetical protein
MNALPLPRFPFFFRFHFHDEFGLVRRMQRNRNTVAVQHAVVGE